MNHMSSSAGIWGWYGGFDLFEICDDIRSDTIIIQG